MKQTLPNETSVRDIVGYAFDQRGGAPERFAATRELRIAAIAGRDGLACGVTFTLIGSPTRGMVALRDIGYGNPGGADVWDGIPLNPGDITILLQFLREIAACEPGKLPAAFSWSSFTSEKPSAN